jgi:hypothetical protein
MKYRFPDWAGSYPEPDEVIEHLMDHGVPEEDAQEYERSHNPLYSVRVEFEYDSETKELKVLEAHIDGTRLIPE